MPGLRTDWYRVVDTGHSIHHSPRRQKSDPAPPRWCLWVTLIIPALAKQGGNQIENIDLTLLRHVSACTRRTDSYIFGILSHPYVSTASRTALVQLLGSRQTWRLSSYPSGGHGSRRGSLNIRLEGACSCICPVFSHFQIDNESDEHVKRNPCHIIAIGLAIRSVYRLRLWPQARERRRSGLLPYLRNGMVWYLKVYQNCKLNTSFSYTCVCNVMVITTFPIQKPAHFFAFPALCLSSSETDSLIHSSRVSKSLGAGLNLS